MTKKIKYCKDEKCGKSSEEVEFPRDRGICRTCYNKYQNERYHTSVHKKTQSNDLLREVKTLLEERRDNDEVLQIQLEKLSIQQEEISAHIKNKSKTEEYDDNTVIVKCPECDHKVFFKGIRGRPPKDGWCKCS